MAIVVLVAMVILFNSMFLTRSFAPEYVGTARMSAPPESTSAGRYSAEFGAGKGSIGRLQTSRSHEADKVVAGVPADTQTTDGLTSRFGYNNAPAQPSTETAKAHSTTPPGPMIVRTASLSLITKDFEKSRAAMEDTLKRHGGYIGQLTVSAPGESGRTLTATLRVPSGQLDAALAELKKLGRVAAEVQNGEEVTQQYVDLEARLTNAKNSEQRLTDILRNRTGKLADVLEVEQAIEEVRGNIEQMEAERKNLAKQVDFATLNTTLTEEYEDHLHAVPESTFTRIWNAAVDGYKTVSESVLNVVLFLFSYGPVLLLWGAVLFFPLRAVWRRLRKKMTPAG
jgi:hypothetical protein